jgi:hypothetical protein
MSKKPDNSPRSADPFDDNFCWFLFLEQPDNEITEDQIEEAYEKSAQWVTCACGQLCKEIPRNECNRPLDADLQLLGVSFMDKLKIAKNVFYRQHSFKEYLDEAKDILIKIEQRTTELLK